MPASSAFTVSGIGVNILGSLSSICTPKASLLPYMQLKDGPIWIVTSTVVPPDAPVDQKSYEREGPVPRVWLTSLIGSISSPDRFRPYHSISSKA